MEIFMMKMRKRKRIFFIVLLTFVAMLIIVVVFRFSGAGHLFGIGTGAGFLNSTNGSGIESYDKTAWKFADLVQADVLYPVIRDIDGDTIIVDVNGHDVTVRLIGADTPETVDPRKPVQCYGPEASAEAKRVFGQKTETSSTNLSSTTGIEVYLDKDPMKGDYDKYGRLLAYVRLPEDIIPTDGISSTTNIYNEYMIMHGFAHEYTFLHQPYEYQTQFKADELYAKKARLGLWGKCPDTGD